MPNIHEVRGVIEELENWHRVRTRLDNKPDRKKRLQLDTLPRAIAVLKEYEQTLIS